MREPPMERVGRDAFDALERLPFVGAMTKEIRRLRALLVDRRAPRLLALGAPGSGKTALLDACLEAEVLGMLRSNEPSSAQSSGSVGSADSNHFEQTLSGARGSWIRVRARGRQLAWLELDATEPPWPSETERRLRNALEEHPPDVVLAVLHAGRWKEELPVVRDSLRRLAERADGRAEDLRVLPVLSAADVLVRPEPFAVPPYPRDALEAIDHAVREVSRRFSVEGLPPRLETSRAVACACPPEPSRRWNVSVLARELTARLPENAYVEAVRALPVPDDEVRALALRIVDHCAGISVVVGLMPVPFSDAVVLVPTQALMVTAIAYVAGQPWDRRAALEWLTSLGMTGGAAVGLRWSARQLLKLWPGGGTLVSASVAGLGTEAIGRSAIAYFIDGPGRRGRARAAIEPVARASVSASRS